jgi:hypothetical protein
MADHVVNGVIASRGKAQLDGESHPPRECF